MPATLLPMLITPFCKKSMPNLLTTLALTLLFTLLNPWKSTLYSHWTIMDPITLTLISLTIYTTILIMMSSYSPKTIFPTIISSTIILILAFSLNDMILFYISFELILIPMFILIMSSGKQPERLQASLFLMLYTITASLPLLASIIFLNTFNNFNIMATSNAQMEIPILLILAFLVKMPMFLSHLWLPKAHVEAPVEGSMILAAILLKLGGYGIIRFLPALMKKINLVNNWIISISLLGASLTSINCIRQKDMKSIIALSSVAHMAMVISSLLTMKYSGLMGAMVMMIGHGLISSALFFMINTFYLKKHTRNILLFKGTKTFSNNLAMWTFILLAANISAPPTINIMSELFIFTSCIQWSTSAMLLLMVTFMLTSSFSMLLFSILSHSSMDIMNFQSQLDNKSNLCFMNHTIPSVLLILKSEMFL